jgi:hypothetical protein
MCSASFITASVSVDDHPAMMQQQEPRHTLILLVAKIEFAQSQTWPFSVALICPCHKKSFHHLNVKPTPLPYGAAPA